MIGMEHKDVVFLVFKTIDKSDLIKEFKENFTTQPEIQKLMYIFQERVAGLGFWYNWYLRGPYSPPLAKTLYEISNSDIETINNTIDNIDNNYGFREDLLEKIASFKELILEIKKIDSDFGLETATALLYIVKRDEPDLYNQKEEIIHYLLLIKSWLDKNKVTLIFDLLFYSQGSKRE